MKTAIYKLLILLLIPLVSFSNDNRGRFKKTKTIEKTFSVNNDALLKVNNRYGNIDITTWNKNTIEIKVVITVNGNDEDQVINRLKGVSISFEGSAQQVLATTHFNKQKSKSWFLSTLFSWGDNSNLNYSINYFIKMPITNNLTIYNDYGNILIDELDGKATINCDYGKLIIGSLNNTNNKLNFDYTNHSTIEFIEGGKINADYSGFTIEKATNLVINADYTSSKIELINKLNFNCDYGNLTVDNAKIVVGNGDYLSMKFGTILDKIHLVANYGSIKIAELADGFSSAKINADYTGIRIGINSNASCNIISELSYGNFRYDGANFTFNKKKVSSTSKYYEGYFGRKNANATILTNTDYGSVKLFETK